MNHPPGLTLEQASALIAGLSEVGVSSVMIAVVPPPPEPVQHHVSIAPQQMIDVMDVTRVLRNLGYGLHHNDAPDPDVPRGFIITPPPPAVDPVEEVVEPEPVIRCYACGLTAPAANGRCRRCGQPVGGPQWR